MGQVDGQNSDESCDQPEGDGSYIGKRHLIHTSIKGSELTIVLRSEQLLTHFVNEGQPSHRSTIGTLLRFDQNVRKI
jgi:hypothetical protein